MSPTPPLDDHFAAQVRGVSGLAMSESINALWKRFDYQRGTPQTTIEAIMCAFRARGMAALKEPATIERLLRCDAAAKTEINIRIASLIAAKEAAA